MVNKRTLKRKRVDQFCKKTTMLSTPGELILEGGFKLLLGVAQLMVEARRAEVVTTPKSTPPSPAPLKKDVIDIKPVSEGDALEREDEAGPGDE